MNELQWMTGAGIASWLVATAVTGTAAATDLLLGMLGPLAAVLGSWTVMERTHRLRPERLTQVMIAAFAAKMIFFGVYVTTVLTVRPLLRPIPFVASFTGHFIGLYGMEALYLRRLLSRDFYARSDARSR